MLLATYRARCQGIYPTTVIPSPASDSIQVEIFLGLTQKESAVRIGVDSYCEGTLISSPIVGSHLIIHPSPITMSGIGGSSISPGYVNLPLRLQWGAPMDTIAAYVVDPRVIPPNCDILTVVLA